MLRRNLLVEKVASPEQKDGKISMSFIASTSAVDRYGDVIDQNGWSLESYKSNNIVLFNHDATELPIGKGLVEVVDGNLMIDIDFDMKDPRAAEIGRKTKDGFLNAVSVGFNPIESVKRSDLPDDHFAKGADGMFFLKSELLEVSVVTIPANSEAVAAKQLASSAEERVFRRIAKHILDIIEEEERFVVYYAKESKEEDEVIEEDEEELEEEFEEEYYDHDSEDEEDKEKSLTYRSTNFPKAGDDLEVDLDNSGYSIFPIAYAENIKLKYPTIWAKGGNILGNKQYSLLRRILKNNGKPKTDNQEKAIRLRESWAARHLKDFRLAGVVAQMKWLVIGSRGISHMKEIIDTEINKIEEEKYLKTLLGEKPNQPAAEKDEIKSLSYLIGLMKTDK